MSAYRSLAFGQAQSPQQILNHTWPTSRRSPDYALREKIIKHVQAMRPAPGVSMEAEKFEGRAEFAIKSAKTEADFLDAAKEYEKALLIAPWVPAYYFNQGIAFEKAGKSKEAKQSFEFYVLAAPNAQDAREVRKRIAGLEYAIEKSTRESSSQAIAVTKQNADEEWIRKVDGRKYRENKRRAPSDRGAGTIPCVNGPRDCRRALGNQRAQCSHAPGHAEPPISRSDSYTISADGDRIIERRAFSDGDAREFFGCGNVEEAMIMKCKITFIYALTLALMILASVSVHAQSSNPQQTLNQYVADLQEPQRLRPAGKNHPARAGDEAESCDTGRGRAPMARGWRP